MTGLHYFFLVLLALAALGHLIGTFKFMERGTGIFVWSLSGVLACLLLVAVNYLYIVSPDLPLIRWICIFGNIFWSVIVILFGRTIQNVKDPRVLMHLVAALGLLVFNFI